jgi:hypothetical protein
VIRFLILTLCSFAFAMVSFGQEPVVSGCQVLPSDNIWNTPVDQLPVHPDSAAYVRTIGLSSPLHPDFGHAAGNGIPYNVVSGSQAKTKVTFNYASESDAGPYPIPANPVIEGGDHHILLIDSTNCVDYELFGAVKNSNGTWSAGSGAIFPLKSDGLRTSGWTSADAAGLPVFPGLVRYDEVASGAIHHAIRFTAQVTDDSFVWPARHAASSVSGSEYPPMGTRFRLKQAFDVSKFPLADQVILNALKKYGMILADNGGPWFITGVPDSRWDDDILHLLTAVTGANLEAVDESSLMVNANSAQAKQSSGTTPGSPAAPAAPSVPTGKWIHFISKSSGKCMESPVSWLGAPLDQRTCSGASNQLLEITPVLDGYKVTVQSSNYQLNIAGGGTADGALLVQYPFAGYPNETWTFAAGTSAGYFTIHPVSSGKCVAVVNGSAADGAKIEQLSCSVTDAEEWKLE